MSPSFTIQRVTPADLPECFALSREAFSTDAHTLMKMHEKGTTDVGSELEPPEYSYRFLEGGEEKGFMLKAVDEGGKILGYSGWGYVGIGKNEKPVPEDDQEPDLLFPIPDPDPSKPPLEQLESITSYHLMHAYDLVCRPGQKVVVCRGITVSPAAQGRGVARAMIAEAKRAADAHGASMWIHLSNDEGGKAAFEKEGFTFASPCKVDLDKYARKPLPEGRDKWGTYEFRLMIRPAQKA